MPRASGSGGGRGDHRTLQRAPVEIPHAHGARHAAAFVRRHHVTVAVVGASPRTLRTRKNLLDPRLEVDDQVVPPGCSVELFLDDEPPAAPVDLAPGVVFGRGVIAVLTRVLPVGEASQLRVGGRVAQRSGVHVVVVTRLRLPDIGAGSELAARIEDRLEGLREHVIALELRTESDRYVELARLGAAEVPPFGACGRVGARRTEQRTEVPDRSRRLAEAEQRRSRAPQLQDDEDGAAAAMVVDVAPMRAGNRHDAVLAAAIGGVRQADPLGVVGGGKGEGASQGQEALHLRRRPWRADRRGVVALDESARSLGQDYSRHQPQAGEHRQGVAKRKATDERERKRALLPAEGAGMHGGTP